MAAADRTDANHARCLQVFERVDIELVLPTMVIAEACYLISRNLGADAEAHFLRRVVEYEIQSPHFDDWPLIANLVERYSDFPLGGTDASVAVLAERLGTDVIITLDRRHFGALRTSDGRPFTLLPD